MGRSICEILGVSHGVAHLHAKRQQVQVEKEPIGRLVRQQRRRREVCEGLVVVPMEIARDARECRELPHLAQQRRLAFERHSFRAA